MNYFAKLTGAVCAVIMSGTVAGAAVMDFDGFNGNNVGYWEEQSYLFNPAKSNNGAQCYETECLMEIGQGDLTTMSYDASGGGPYAQKTGGSWNDVSGYYTDTFNLDFFYMVLIGLGDEQLNALKVIGTYADGSGTVEAEFVLGQATGATATDANISFAAGSDWNSIGNKVDDGVINDNTGYWVDLGDSWHGLSSVSWFLNTAEGPGKDKVLSAQAVMDCVGSFEDVTGGQSGCEPSIVPLPAAGWLLIAGLGGLAAMKRRRT